MLSMSIQYAKYSNNTRRQRKKIMDGASGMMGLAGNHASKFEKQIILKLSDTDVGGHSMNQISFFFSSFFFLLSSFLLLFFMKPAYIQDLQEKKEIKFQTRLIYEMNKINLMFCTKSV